MTNAANRAATKTFTKVRLRTLVWTGVGALVLGLVIGAASAGGAARQPVNAGATPNPSASAETTRITKESATAKARVTQLEAELAAATKELTAHKARIVELEAAAKPAAPEPAAPAPAAPAPAKPAPAAPAPAEQPKQAPQQQSSFENCAAARAAGAAPVHRGDPGYGKHLDRDNDGIGCE